MDEAIEISADVRARLSRYTRSFNFAGSSAPPRPPRSTVETVLVPADKSRYLPSIWRRQKHGVDGRELECHDNIVPTDTEVPLLRWDPPV